MSLVSNVKKRRNLSQNEQLWQTLDIGNTFGPTFGFKSSQLFQFEEFEKFTILLISIIVHMEKLCTTLGPLHTLQALSWRKRRSLSKFASHYTWGTNIVCECKMVVNSTWIPTWHRMDHVLWSLGLFQKPPLGGRPNTKPGEYGTINAHNHWCTPMLSCVMTRMSRISSKSHLVEGPVMYAFTLTYHLKVRDHTMCFRRCLGTAFAHFLLGSHNFMVTSFGSCVKWPLHFSRPGT